MARIKNATFQGVPVADVDPDAPTFFHALEDAIGDTALVNDMLTGQNGETNTIVRDGTAGRGARLGIPLVNQWIGRNFTCAGGVGVGDVFYVVAMPLFIPPGEDTIVVHLVAATLDTDVSATLPPRCYLRTPAAFAANGDDYVTMEPVAELNGGLVLYEARITGITSGLALFFISKIGSDYDWYVESLSIHHGRRLMVGPPQQQADSPIRVPSPSLVQALPHTSFDSALIGVSGGAAGINGVILTQLNGNQNAIEEHTTGWPAGGNAAYTLEDQTGAGVADRVNPALSRFLAHTRAVDVNEGEVAFPVWAEAFGACLAAPGYGVDQTEPPTTGVTEWYAPWVKFATTAITTVREGVGVFPDFQTGSSRLKMAILAVTENSVLGDISNFDGSCGQSGSEGTGTFAVVPGTGTAGSTPMLALATASGLGFSADAIGSVIRVRVTCTGVRKSIGDLAVLGACLYFEP